RTWFAIYEEFARRACWGRNNPVVQAIVVGKWRHADKRFLAWAIRGKDIYEDDVVVDRERRNRRAIGPHEVILTPAFAIAFKRKVRIIRDDVAVHVLHALLHQGVGEHFQRLDRMIVPLRAKVVRQFASGKIGIAVSD